MSDVIVIVHDRSRATWPAHAELLSTAKQVIAGDDTQRKRLWRSHGMTLAWALDYLRRRSQAHNE